MKVVCCFAGTIHVRLSMFAWSCDGRWHSYSEICYKEFVRNSDHRN